MANKSDIPKYVKSLAGKYRILNQGSHAPPNPRTSLVKPFVYKFWNVSRYIPSSGANAVMFPRRIENETCSAI
jgi:hypothetical protein